MTQTHAPHVEEIDERDENWPYGYWEPRGAVAVGNAMNVEIDALADKEAADAVEREMDALVDEGALDENASSAQKERLIVVTTAALDNVLEASGLSREEARSLYFQAYPERIGKAQG